MITPVNVMAPSCFIQELPRDVAVRILWDLAPRDISNLRLCSRHWVLVSESYLKEHCLPHLKAFMHVIYESKLRIDSRERHEIKMFEADAYKEGTFSETIERIWILREYLIAILKEVDVSSLFVMLQGLQKPIFFDKLFDLVRIMKETRPHESTWSYPAKYA